MPLYHLALSLKLRRLLITVCFVVATFELQRCPQLESFLVRSLWENGALAQVESVLVDGALRDIGLATLISDTVVNRAGIMLLSDSE